MDEATLLQVLGAHDQTLGAPTAVSAAYQTHQHQQPQQQQQWA